MSVGLITYIAYLGQNRHLHGLADGPEKQGGSGKLLRGGEGVLPPIPLLSFIF